MKRIAQTLQVAFLRRLGEMAVPREQWADALKWLRFSGSDEAPR